MLIGGLFGSMTIQAATINVPADHSTISAAVAAASPGDVIVVAAGTYNESILINKSLVLRGAQANICAVTTRTGAESIINCTNGIGVNADNV